MATSPGPSQRMPAQNPGQPGWMPQSASSPAFNNSPHQHTPASSADRRISATESANAALGNDSYAGRESWCWSSRYHSASGERAELGQQRHSIHRLPGQIPQSIFSVNPLSREVFQKMFYEQWLPRQAAKDKSILRWEGRDIDLYQLHCEVFSAGSVKQVGYTLDPGRRWASRVDADCLINRSAKRICGP